VAVRRYLRYGLSYRDVEELLAEHGVTASTLIGRALHPPQIPASHCRRPAPGACGPRLARKAPSGPPRPVRHASASQRDPTGRHRTPGTIPPPAIPLLTCEDATPLTQGGRS
jgi:hypothetical protein